MKLNRVLVPLDGSTLAERALCTALMLLRESPAATLMLMRAARATARPPWEDPIDAQVEAVDEATSYLKSVARRLGEEDPRRRITTSVWYGLPARSIVDAADASRAELIVMSTHGRSGLRRMVLGSVAESVLRAATTPVLLVPADARHLSVASPLPTVTHSAEALRV